MAEKAEVIGMGLYEELKKMEFVRDSEFGSGEERTELWVNEKAGMAVRLEWYPV